MDEVVAGVMAGVMAGAGVFIRAAYPGLGAVWVGAGWGVGLGVGLGVGRGPV